LFLFVLILLLFAFKLKIEQALGGSTPAQLFLSV